LIAGLREQLRAGSQALGVPLGDGAIERLGTFLDLLEKWNKVYNLTAIRDTSLWASHHVLDSLAIVPHLPRGSLLDVGSGGGFPGIPVAIVQPDRKVTLLDSNQKKSAFLRQVAADLALANVSVAAERVEDHRPAPGYDVVVSRAFSDLSDFAGLAGGALAPGGVLVAMKGVHPYEEIARVPAGWAHEVVELRVPGLDAARHLVFLRAAAENAQ
jgi:16S rRNA (guanine527-N7)-methyltransferase